LPLWPGVVDFGFCSVANPLSSAAVDHNDSEACGFPYLTDEWRCQSMAPLTAQKLFSFYCLFGRVTLISSFVLWLASLL
jgi:hypothetical protein